MLFVPCEAYQYTACNCICIIITGIPRKQMRSRIYEGYSSTFACKSQCDVDPVTLKVLCNCCKLRREAAGGQYIPWPLIIQYPGHAMVAGTSIPRQNEHITTAQEDGYWSNILALPCACIWHIKTIVPMPASFMYGSADTVMSY